MIYPTQLLLLVPNHQCNQNVCITNKPTESFEKLHFRVEICTHPFLLHVWILWTIQDNWIDTQCSSQHSYYFQWEQVAFCFATNSCLDHDPSPTTISSKEVSFLTCVSASYAALPAGPWGSYSDSLVAPDYKIRIDNGHCKANARQNSSTRSWTRSKKIKNLNNSARIMRLVIKLLTQNLVQF